MLGFEYSNVLSKATTSVNSTIISITAGTTHKHPILYTYSTHTLHNYYASDYVGSVPLSLGRSVITFADFW